MSNLVRLAIAGLSVYGFCKQNRFLANAASLARGFGDQYNWKNLKTGLEEAQKEKKPIMLIIHKPWCRSCRAMKPRIAQSEEIQELSSKFVMVNVEDDAEVDDPEYMPDGDYIPRVLFLSPNGKVAKGIFNEYGHPGYKYFYQSPGPIADAMRRALKDMGFQ